MENHCLQPSSLIETHPYAYLTLLNNLYSYYELDGKKYANKTSKLQPKSFNKIDVPDVLYKDYIQQKQNNKKSYKKRTHSQNKDPAIGTWKGHLESLKKYKRVVSARRLKPAYEIPFAEQNRICSQDPKNIFLKKLVRSELQSQVLCNLKTLSNQNKYRNITSRNIKTSQSNTRPQSKIRHPLTAKHLNRSAKKSLLDTQLNTQFQNIFTIPINQLQNYDTTSLIKQSNNLRQLDTAISYKNIEKVTKFIRKVHTLQDQIQNY